jgi:Na+-translocating ferredoxin:NAD+ oxidoreductase RnfE subunit
LEIDPNYINSAIWADIKIFTQNIKFFVLFIIIFAANMLVGHNAIPSLVKSHHLPASVSKLRPPIYVVALISFVAAIYFVITAFAGGLEAIRAIYPDFWI